MVYPDRSHQGKAQLDAGPYNSDQSLALAYLLLMAHNQENSEMGIIIIDQLAKKIHPAFTSTVEWKPDSGV